MNERDCLCLGCSSLKLFLVQLASFSFSFSLCIRTMSFFFILFLSSFPLFFLLISSLSFLYFSFLFFSNVDLTHLYIIIVISNLILNRPLSLSSPLTLLSLHHSLYPGFIPPTLPLALLPFYPSDPLLFHSPPFPVLFPSAPLHPLDSLSSRSPLPYFPPPSNPLSLIPTQHLFFHLTLAQLDQNNKNKKRHAYLSPKAPLLGPNYQIQTSREK
ncbi:hypothetical protein BCR41DRAFT_251257 [Lobosporangium transversale]|uniref:Uncharacterized protein n=1 Tax=Lobosporangium transversale TaxID=64571 RepID=A0A1Y2G387_9FUNG|nr:hypothetical protein BCR41DRAFT_251257 [Lobosporangium transversale]ORY92384.1 hypothetical protein BCR41DRAFT_251257 [Lobosporangium transversale]|eukprot:XP_021875129.1 hypothetical protein BCR41DRAFT_251257 [Lobosporangium transversale]